MGDNILPTTYTHSALSSDVVGATSWKGIPVPDDQTNQTIATNLGLSSRYIILKTRSWKVTTLEEYGRTIDFSKKLPHPSGRYPTGNPQPRQIYNEFISQTVKEEGLGYLPGSCYMLEKSNHWVYGQRWPDNKT